MRHLLKQSRICGRALFVLFLVFVAAGGANSQWTATNLHPAGDWSRAQGGYGTHQVGLYFYWDGNVPHGVMWSSSAASFVELTPAGYFGSEVFAADANQQVGTAVSFYGDSDHASLWSGTADSWIDLNPVGATSSEALGVGDGQQVGDFSTNTLEMGAALWTGTAASFVNLTPLNATHAMAFGVGGGQQVGRVNFGNVGPHAALWTGSAESFVDLHPDGAQESIARDVENGVQVGYARIGGWTRAGYWTGTAASWTSLHPSSFLYSELFGIGGGYQVGFVAGPINNHASFWNGTVESCVDLHAFLPSGYDRSVAYGVSVHDGVIHVVGLAQLHQGFRDQAMLWTRPEPHSPSSFRVLAGQLRSGGLESLLLSDDKRMEVNPSIQDETLPALVEMTSQVTVANPAELRFTVESSVSTAVFAQEIWLFSYATNRWVRVDVRRASASDAVAQVVVSKNAAQFVNPADLSVRARVGWRFLSAEVAVWHAGIDQAYWSATR